MLTQNPTLRAAAVLKGATKPVRVYLGLKNGRWIAAFEFSAITKGLPWTLLTVDPSTPETDLADLIASRWENLATEYATGHRIPTSIPTPRHVWRQPQRSAAR